MGNEVISNTLELAATSTDFRARIGCVITDKRGRVVSSGINQRKTHPMQSHFAKLANREKHFLHAEIAALVKCRKDPHTMYIGRLKKDNTPGMARPCPICLMAIKEAGVKQVVFTTDDGSLETITP